MTPYQEKLQDPRWQKKRLKILERDGWKCQHCGDDQTTLHVHHKYYELNADPWDYPDKALIALCKDCHDTESEEIELSIGYLKRELKAIFMSTDIYWFECFLMDCIDADCEKALVYFIKERDKTVPKIKEIYKNHLEFMRTARTGYWTVHNFETGEGNEFYEFYDYEQINQVRLYYEDQNW